MRLTRTLALDVYPQETATANSCRLTLVALKHGFFFFDECLIGAFEILCLHANSLRLCFRLDGRIQ